MAKTLLILTIAAALSVFITSAPLAQSKECTECNLKVRAAIAQCLKDNKNDQVKCNKDNQSAAQSCNNTCQKTLSTPK